ncbi:DUF2750 domain-containing protein [Endozoicomonadaceae bacterium StTr2]
MAYKLNSQQYENVCRLSDDQRLDYFLKKVTDFEEIWSLHSNDGWVALSSADGEDCLPIWPHPDFAKAWATGDWSDCTPKAIKLDYWIERWTPGLERDHTMLAVFPVGEEEGIVLSPAELQESLVGLLEQF